MLCSYKYKDIIDNFFKSTTKKTRSVILNIILQKCRNVLCYGDENFAKTFKGTIKFIPLLSEGGAAFVTDYIYNYKATIGPGVFYQEQLDYCNKNKKQLWQDFLQEDNFNQFFWATNAKYPVQRIGYYLGYQVCKSYLDKSKNKKQAIKEIIEVTDWDSFVRKSGFGLQ